MINQKLPSINDLKPSFVVFLVALPLCLGIALASGAPASSGIISGIIGGIVVGYLSGSQISVSGPAAGLTLIVFNSIKELGSFEAFALAVAVSGLIQLAFGFFKLGVLANYIPVSVIKGMLAAIGIIIILKQIPHFLGLDVDQIGEMEFFQADGENTFSELLNAFQHVNQGALLIGILSVLTIFGWEFLSKKNKWVSFIPAALIAVIFGVIVNVYLFAGSGFYLEQEHLVSLPPIGDIFVFKNPFSSFNLNLKMMVIALTIAVVGSIESLLSIEASEKLDPFKRVVDQNRELKAQGVGNFLSGLLGGLPLTAVIVRTSANVNSGGTSKWSCIIHGIFLLLSVILLPGVLNKIPLSVLATILLFVGFKLTSPKLYKSYLLKEPSQYIPFLTTILAILFTDLLIGVGIGLFVLNHG